MVLLPFSVLWWLGQLFRHLHRFRHSDVVIVNPHMVNYGNSLMTQDIARRFFRGRKVTYVLVWFPDGTQNTKIGLIWSDLDVVLVRRAAVSFSFFGKYFIFPGVEILTPTLKWVTSVFMSALAPKADFVTAGGIRNSLPVPPDLADIIAADYGSPEWNIVYTHVLWARMLKSDQQAVKPAFPEREREAIYARLRRVCERPKPRLCMLYNRSLENTERSGSPVENYLATMRLLIDNGYVILLMTDQGLDEDQMSSFGRMVVDAERLGVDPDLYRLFVPTEAEICIGDAGAGMALPMIMGTPCLVLNFHSIGCTLPGTWVYPKRVVDSSGTPVPYPRVITEDPYGYCDPEPREHEDWVRLTNSSDEILEAVQCFLEYLSGNEFLGIGDELNALAPRLSMFSSFGSRVSPAYIRRNSMKGAREDYVECKENSQESKPGTPPLKDIFLEAP